MSSERTDFIKEARSLGIGDLTLGHRKLVDEPLTGEDWSEVRRATLAYQFHLKLIVAKARAKGKG